jgi:hypothetical protein
MDFFIHGGGWNAVSPIKRQYPSDYKQNELFQPSFNASLEVDFQGSRVTSDGGLILVRELNERLRFGELNLAPLLLSVVGYKRRPSGAAGQDREMVAAELAAPILRRWPLPEIPVTPDVIYKLLLYIAFIQSNFALPQLSLGWYWLAQHGRSPSRNSFISCPHRWRIFSTKENFLLYFSPPNREPISASIVVFLHSTDLAFGDIGNRHKPSHNLDE